PGGVGVGRRAPRGPDGVQPRGERGGPPVPPFDVLAWHRREAEACQRDRFWHGAAWHLDHLIAAEPEQARHYVDAAHARTQLGRHRQVVADSTPAIALGGKEARAWCYRGAAHLGL